MTPNHTDRIRAAAEEIENYSKNFLDNYCPAASTMEPIISRHITESDRFRAGVQACVEKVKGELLDNPDGIERRAYWNAGVRKCLHEIESITDSAASPAAQPIEKGDTITFRDGDEIKTGVVEDFAPRVFGGSGCCIQTSAGWTDSESVTNAVKAPAAQQEGDSGELLPCLACAEGNHHRCIKNQIPEGLCGCWSGRGDH